MTLFNSSMKMHSLAVQKSQKEFLTSFEKKTKRHFYSLAEQTTSVSNTLLKKNYAIPSSLLISMAKAAKVKTVLS